MNSLKSLFSKDHKIFRLAASSRFIPHVVFLIIIFYVLMALSGLIDMPLSSMFRSISTTTLNGRALYTAINRLAIRFGSIVIAFFAYVKFIERRSISTMGFELNGVMKKYVRGFVIGVLLIIACIVILLLVGTLTVNRDTESGSVGITALSGVLIMLFGWIVQGASEEIVFRGWLFPLIGVKHNVALAIIASSAFFGYMHSGNANISLLPMINLILFGVLAAVYVIWEGSLWGICALHSAWNWAQGNLFGIQVSGGSTVGGMLVDLDAVSGYDLITGGPFGLEGGLACTFVLLAVIIVLVKLIAKRSYSVSENVA